jgi:hypothetical protein
MVQYDLTGAKLFDGRNRQQSPYKLLCDLNRNLSQNIFVEFSNGVQFRFNMVATKLISF